MCELDMSQEALFEYLYLIDINPITVSLDSDE